MMKTSQPHHRPTSVVKPWLAVCCNYMQQTVLLTALRGCDGLPKSDPSKALVRALRGVLLADADPLTGFINTLEPDDIKKFLAAIDAYPLHWYTHFMFAAEIIGYKHPQQRVAEWWHNLYCRMVDAIHLEIETEAGLDDRLDK